MLITPLACSFVVCAVVERRHSLWRCLRASSPLCKSLNKPSPSQVRLCPPNTPAQGAKMCKAVSTALASLSCEANVRHTQNTHTHTHTHTHTQRAHTLTHAHAHARARSLSLFLSLSLSLPLSPSLSLSHSHSLTSGRGGRGGGTLQPRTDAFAAGIVQVCCLCASVLCIEVLFKCIVFVYCLGVLSTRALARLCV